MESHDNLIHNWAPVLFIHGLGGDHYYDQQTVRKMAASKYQHFFVC